MCRCLSLTEIRLCPWRKLCRLPACYLVCKRDSVARIRTQVRISLEVAECLCHLRASGEETGEHFLWNLFDGELVALSIQGVNDFTEAHEISDEWQILTIACLLWVCECAGNNLAQFANVSHVNANHIWDRGEEPSPVGHVLLCLPAAPWRRSLRLVFYRWITRLFFVLVERPAGHCRSQSFSLVIHSRIYGVQLSSFTPSASQRTKKCITSRSITPTSFRSKTMSRRSVWHSKSLFNSAMACLSIRPLRMNTVDLPRAAVSILKAID